MTNTNLIMICGSVYQTISLKISLVDSGAQKEAIQMSKLDEIFRKRLERIREELNSYIESRMTITEQKLFATVPGRVTEKKKKGGVQDKFLNYMKLSDDSEDEFGVDYLDEVDECLGLPSQEAEPKKSVRLEAPGQPSAYIPPSSVMGVPAGTVKIPDFLKKDRERSELDKVLAKKEESFSEMLLRMIDEKGLKDSDVYKRANIDRRLFSKIRGDVDYVPSKKTAISFGLALQLEMDEVKTLLATAGYTLSASSRFDLIIMYLIETKEYNIHFANIVLDDYGEGTLSR